jgi:multidrug efflux pump subunit AcrB
VINSVTSLVTEGIIGAILTGLMVMLFLGDVRGALIVIFTIPISIISSVLFLNLFGQTINIMTLSGLALAIGILVDESTVTIENIHQHLDMGKPKALAIWDACKEIAFPKLLILFCILAVFAPAFTMGGIPVRCSLPLALAIGFSMVASYFLAQTFVPVLANWLMKVKHHKHPSGRDMTDAEELAAAGLSDDEEEAWKLKAALAEGRNIGHKQSMFDKMRKRYLSFIARMMPYRKPIVITYVIVVCAFVAWMLNGIGRDVLPKANGKQFQVRLRLPDGTRIENTEKQTIKL